MTIWLWQALFVLAVAAIPITNALTLQHAMGRLRFVAMDSRDTFYLANMGNFETAQQVHNEIAKMAAETMFNRNPDGYDNPERLERLFNPEMTSKLKAAEGNDAEIFRSQSIHQKIETGLIREINTDSNNAIVSVEGQILRTGTFNQRTVNNARNVTVFLNLKLNSDMALNGRYPLVVVNFEERF